MSEPTRPADPFAAALARFAVDTAVQVPDDARLGAKRVVADSIAVATGALRHPAAQAARRFARRFPMTPGATVWGTRLTTAPQHAALANGVPLRGYDFNDLYSGGAAGGHPSDILPALVAAAEASDASPEQLLTAIAVGYEVTLTLFDVIPTKANGWDYPNLTALGAVCGAARLLGLGIDATMEALSIVATYHHASSELGSNELNSRGELTMWRRFNGANAARVAVDACLLAEAGVEGVYRAFTGPAGFLQRFGAPEPMCTRVVDALDPARPLSRITDPTFKRWPVGSRAQSAIQAALAARAQLDDVAEIETVRVVADADAYHHLVEVRGDAWRPHSRETADHSLPYVVAAAVLDGGITSASFEPALVNDPRRLDFLLRRVTVDRAADARRSHGSPTSVIITTRSGRVMTGEALPPPGHPLNPLSNADFEAKLSETLGELIGLPAARRIAERIWSFEAEPSVSGLLHSLAAPEGVDIDGPGN